MELISWPFLQPYKLTVKFPAQLDKDNEKKFGDFEKQPFLRLAISATLTVCNIGRKKKKNNKQLNELKMSERNTIC